MKKAGFIFILMGLSISMAYAQTRDLPTYYPSPFGSYARLRLEPRPAVMAEPACPNDGSMWGLMYMDESGNLLFCDWDGSVGSWRPVLSPWIHDKATDNVYLFDDDADTNGTKAFVGIGTNTPADRLDLADSQGNIRLYDGNGETAHILGSNGSGNDGIILRTVTDPAPGQAIFAVESSGGASQRLRVEHAGAVKMDNVLEVDGAGDSYIAGSLGLGGETAPVNALDVSGTAVIGASYAGTEDAVVNGVADGLLVEGDVAIGKTSLDGDPGLKLDVNGNLKVNNTIFFEGGGSITDDGLNFIFNH